MLVVSLPFFVWGGGERTMSVGWPLNRTETLALAAVVVPTAAAFMIAYVVHEDFRAWVRQQLRWTRRWPRLVLAMVLLVLAGYVVWTWRELWWAAAIGVLMLLLRLFRPEVRAGIERVHLRLLWKLVASPARDHFGLEASDADFGPAVTFIETLRPTLRKLDYDYVALLGRALSSRKPGSREAIMEWPEVAVMPDARDWWLFDMANRIRDGSERLREVGAIDMWVATPDKTKSFFELKFVFPIAASSALERLRVLVEVERARREMLELMKAPRERQPDSTATEQSVWAQEVDELSIAAAWLLFKILVEHRRPPPADVLILHSEMKALADQIHVPLPKLRESCAELVGARFLEDFDWRADDEAIQLVAKLAERVKSNKVGYQLMLAIGSRMEAERVWGSSASP